MCSSPFPGNDRSIINGERERTCPLSFDLPERANCPSLGGSFENRGIFSLSFSMSVCLLLTEDSLAGMGTMGGAIRNSRSTQAAQPARGQGQVREQCFPSKCAAQLRDYLNGGWNQQLETVIEINKIDRFLFVRICDFWKEIYIYGETYIKRRDVERLCYPKILFIVGGKTKRSIVHRPFITVYRRSRYEDDEDKEKARRAC